MSENVDSEIDTAVEHVLEESAPTGGGGAGGQFAVSPEALEGLIGRWDGLIERIGAAGLAVNQAMMAVDLPPAEDRPSGDHTAAVRESLLQAAAHNEQMTGYATAFQRRLRAAHAAYTGTETVNAELIGRIREA